MASSSRPLQEPLAAGCPYGQALNDIDASGQPTCVPINPASPGSVTVTTQVVRSAAVTILPDGRPLAMFEERITAGAFIVRSALCADPQCSSISVIDVSDRGRSFQDTPVQRLVFGADGAMYAIVSSHKVTLLDAARPIGVSAAYGPPVVVYSDGGTGLKVFRCDNLNCASNVRGR